MSVIKVSSGIVVVTGGNVARANPCIFCVGTRNIAITIPAFTTVWTCYGGPRFPAPQPPQTSRNTQYFSYPTSFNLSIPVSVSGVAPNRVCTISTTHLTGSVVDRQFFTDGCTGSVKVEGFARVAFGMVYFESTQFQSIDLVVSSREPPGSADGSARTVVFNMQGRTRTASPFGTFDVTPTSDAGSGIYTPTGGYTGTLTIS